MVRVDGTFRNPKLWQLLHLREADRHPQGARGGRRSAQAGGPPRLAGLGRSGADATAALGEGGRPGSAVRAAEGMGKVRSGGWSREPAGAWRRAGSAPGTGRGRAAAGAERRRCGARPPPRCMLSGAGGEPQTKSRGRSRAGTGARRGRPGGGDAAGAAARGTGEPSPGAGRRGSWGCARREQKAPPARGERRGLGLRSTMPRTEPGCAWGVLLTLCSLSAAQPRERQ